MSSTSLFEMVSWLLYKTQKYSFNWSYLGDSLSCSNIKFLYFLLGLYRCCFIRFKSLFEVYPTQDALQLSSVQLKENATLEISHKDYHTSVLRVENYYKYPMIFQYLVLFFFSVCTQESYRRGFQRTNCSFIGRLRRRTNYTAKKNGC